MVIRPCSAYFSAQARMYGAVRSQLTHVNVQKFVRTTCPRRSSGERGGELIHPFAPSKGGMRVAAWPSLNAMPRPPRSFGHHQERLSLLDEVRRELGRVTAADVPHGVNRFGRHEQDITFVQ